MEHPALSDLVLQLIAERHGQVSQAEVAQCIGVSTTWLRHAFKRTVKVSFRDVCLEAKLSHGAYLLRSTSLSIIEISARLGYSDRTKFEKAFKHAQGISPTTYRRATTTNATTNI
jgi:AraC-like DNA-binding protein